MFDGRVGSLFPDDHEAYARVFHPAWLGAERVTWAGIAAANGRVAHPEMQLSSLVGRGPYEPPEQPGVFDEAPRQGELPEAVAGPLAEVLARHTATPERCEVWVWEGWGDLTFDGPPTVEVPGRRYHVVTAPVDEVHRHRPALWRPEDRAWCVATEVDLMTTYVGGSAACVAGVLAHPGLEALPSAADHRITWDADTVNPLPEL